MITLTSVDVSPDLSHAKVFFTVLDKEYVATLKLGERTATGDVEGEIVERKDIPADLQARLPSVLQAFTGEIEQVPPMYSALKREGVPLYELARRGETVVRQARRVRI